jgi:LysM repeat protein
MKIKIPTFLRRKPKKLRASTARRPLRIAATADYDEMAEPNMKLSRALLIVLVLHVVAVSGIIAFNAIKTRQNPRVAPASATITANISTPTTKSEVSTAHSVTSQKETVRRDESKQSRSPGKQTAKEDKKAEHSKFAALANTDSGKVYVVAKGDNPVTIAKKLKVSYDELLALNHIEDPHKLKIGQKLLIPSKSAKGKKADE